MRNVSINLILMVWSSEFAGGSMPRLQPPAWRSRVPSRKGIILGGGFTSSFLSYLKLL